MPADPRTWDDMARLAGIEHEQECGYVLWNCTAFPFTTPRVIWKQLRHAVRFAKLYGRWPEPGDTPYAR